VSTGFARTDTFQSYSATVGLKISMSKPVLGHPISVFNAECAETHQTLIRTDRRWLFFGRKVSTGFARTDTFQSYGATVGLKISMSKIFFRLRSVFGVLLRVFRWKVLRDVRGRSLKFPILRWHRTIGTRQYENRPQDDGTVFGSLSGHPKLDFEKFPSPMCIRASKMVTSRVWMPGYRSEIYLYLGIQTLLKWVWMPGHTSNVKKFTFILASKPYWNEFGCQDIHPTWKILPLSWHPNPIEMSLDARIYIQREKFYLYPGIQTLLKWVWMPGHTSNVKKFTFILASKPLWNEFGCQDIDRTLKNRLSPIYILASKPLWNEFGCQDIDRTGAQLPSSGQGLDARI